MDNIEDVDVSDDLQPFKWDGDTIEFGEALRERGRAYATKTITDRALPDARDGLLPVHRRVLTTMHDLKLYTRNGKPKKSSKIVGDTMGSYHPHGDSSIYEAMVRMAQGFQLTEPLVRGYGNWGSLDGDPAAAMRYTEASLAEAGADCVVDLRPETVHYAPTFDESGTEPRVLPVPFPNLLVNGVSGIAYGMACSFPPHNMAEAIDAALYVADNPEAKLKTVMRRLPAPDFPCGGIIVNPEALENAYKTGQGTCLLQAQFHVEHLPGNQQAIVITELPHLVGPGKVAKDVVNGVLDGKITEVTETPIDLSDQSGMRLMIKCKRGGSIETLVSQLLKLNSMRKTISINFNALVDGTKPRKLGLVDILKIFVDFRNEIVTKRLEHELNVLQSELHRLLGLIAASDAIDEVVKIIRSSENADAARPRLMKKLKYTPHGKKKAVFIDEVQANAILALRLSRLTKLNQFELHDEAKKKMTRIDEILEILNSENGVMDIVKNELRQVKKKYGRSRSTSIHEGGAVRMVGGRREVDAVTAEAEDITAYIARSGAALLQPVKGRRAGSGIPLKLKGADELSAVVDTSTDKPIMVVSSNGMAYRVQLTDTPLSSRASTGRSLLALPKGEQVIGAFVESEDLPHLLMVTRNGQLKRISIEEVLAGAHAGGIPAYGVGEGDEIVSVIPHAEGDHVIIATALGQALRLDTAKNMRTVKTGSAGGVAGIKLKGKDRVVSACRVDPDGDSILTIHETGMGKRVSLDEYPTKGRATGGVMASATNKPAKSPAGEVVMIACVPAKDSFQLVMKRASLVSFDPKRVPVVSRAVIPKAAIDIGPGDAPFSTRRVD